MGQLIKLEDALICCGGNSAQLLKDTRANFAALASEFLAEHGKALEAGAPLAQVGAMIVFAVKSIAAVARPAGLEANPLGLGIGAAAQFEWIPPELQIKPNQEINQLGAIDIDQALTLMNVAAEQALARHRQRVRKCHLERALRQDNPARYVSGTIRSRRARPKIGAALLRFVKNLVGKP